MRLRIGRPVAALSFRERLYEPRWPPMTGGQLRLPVRDDLEGAYRRAYQHHRSSKWRLPLSFGEEGRELEVLLITLIVHSAIGIPLRAGQDVLERNHVPQFLQ